MEFVITIPAGPDFDPRMKLTLESLHIQKAKVKAALCDVSDDSKCHALIHSYEDLISYTRHGPDKGQSDAINEGWRAVQGDIYGWLNVDDFLAPDALEIAERIFTDNPDIDVVYGQSLIMEGKSFIGLHSEVRPITDDIYRSNIISQPSCFVRRSALFNVGLLDVDLHYTMDWDLWARLYEAGAKFHYVPEVLSVVAWEQTTKTASFNMQRYKELLRLPRRHAGRCAAQRTALSFLLEHLSQYGFAQPVFRTLLRSIRKKNAVPDRRWRPVGAKADGGSNAQNIICEVPLFHYEDSTDVTLALGFTHAAKRQIEVGGEAPITHEKPHADIDVRLSSGRAKIIRITAAQGHMSDLRSITWK